MKMTTIPDPTGERHGLRLRHSGGLLVASALLLGSLFPLSSLGGQAAGATLPHRAQASPVRGAGAFVPVPPVRVTDTRAGSGLPNADHPLQPGEGLNVQVGGRGAHDGVPLSASAVILNLTVIRPRVSGLLTVYAAGRSPLMPGTPGVIFAAGQTTAASVTTPMNSSGQVSIEAIQGATVTANIVVDVFGYYTSHFAASGPGLYDAISPGRVLGTLRSGARLASDSTTAVRVTGRRTGVPLGAEAVVVNLTATEASTGSYLSLYEQGTSRPVTSNLNVVPQEIAANQATVRIGKTGQIDLYNHAGSVSVDLDIDGYYTASGGSGSVYVPIDPEPIAATGSSITAPVPSKASVILHLSFANLLDQTVPATATAVETVFEVSPQLPGGYLTVYPSSDTMPPISSNLTWTSRSARQVAVSVTNQVTADTAGTGRVAVFNGSARPVNLTLYVWGYFVHER